MNVPQGGAVCGMADEGEDSRACWPSFLEELDRDPERAFRGFYEFFMRAARARQPATLRHFPWDERQDLLHDLVLLFVERDFRKLKTYKDNGKPFIVWMYCVVNHHLIERLRDRSRDVARLANVRL
jgi:hypothetical protein